MNRRRFLRISALSAASLTVTGPPPEVTAASDFQTLTRPDVLGLLGTEVVREIGAQYRRLVPTEGDWSALHAAILARHGGGPSIAAMVRSDFDDGRVVLLNGWVLAVTEARQCALFSLLS